MAKYRWSESWSSLPFVFSWNSVSEQSRDPQGFYALRKALYHLQLTALGDKTSKYQMFVFKILFLDKKLSLFGMKGSHSLLLFLRLNFESLCFSSCLCISHWVFCPFLYWFAQPLARVRFPHVPILQLITFIFCYALKLVCGSWF